MEGNEIFLNFLQGGWLLLLIIPLLFLLFNLQRYRHKKIHLYSSTTKLLVPRSKKITYTKIAGWALIWILSCIAFMQPIGNVHYGSQSTSKQPRYASHEILFLVDTSASMGVKDESEKRTRLEQSKFLMEGILQKLQGQSVSLYAFTSKLTPLVPSTLDYLFTRLAIHDLTLNEGDVGGTLFTPVLKALNAQIFTEPFNKNISIIFLSDGGDNSGNAQEEILKQIPDPKEKHYNLFTLGLGSFQASPIPNVLFHGQEVQSKQEKEILEIMAKRGNGHYYNSHEWTPGELSTEILNRIGNDPLIFSEEGRTRNVALTSTQDYVYDLYFQIPLGLALMFYVISMLLPDVSKKYSKLERI